MLVLALDTSTPLLSVAVADVRADDVACRASRATAADRRHGELLAVLVSEVLREAGAVPGDLAAVAAGLGPGPFTGLRAGVMTAVALADALGIPSYGACSLDVIAAQRRTDGERTAVVTDALRKQVYWAAYDAAGRRVDGPDIGFPEDVAQRCRAVSDAVIGPGREKYADAFVALKGDAEVWPVAATLAELVADRVRSQAAAERLEPLYLRRPDAQPPGRPKHVLPA
ncbi:MAG: tRNA (adenosine(37)-N6)-threonylcarbamoyltransferase complex dimerization subunit type 1 TsaB [Frankiales bacterium]|nr:tRNA (adenosine(37)-N6)-threonylcarbamoyltransferase complex dimerization subunit type 1 TsaB [Frankiales bacterium]